MQLCNKCFRKFVKNKKHITMKNKISKLSFALVFVLIIGATFSLSSCKKKDAPAIPPESTFKLTGLDGDTTKSVPNIGYENWFIASSNVGVWTLITTVVMAVPVAAYEHALEQEAQHVSGDKWVWEYQFGIGFKIYTVQLFGEKSKEEVTWEMHVSLTGDFQDFVWFTGTQNLEGTAGQWIIYKSPTENHQLLQIDWTKNLTDNTGTLKYTNIEPEGAENGGYIYYGNDQSGEYNAFFDIFNKGQNNLTEIDVNTTYSNGRIKNPNYYKDSIWHCWNTQLLDDFCDQPAK